MWPGYCNACDCPAPLIGVVRRSSSKSKCGFAAFVGTSVYLSRIDQDDHTLCGDSCISATATYTYNRLTCLVTGPAPGDCVPDMLTAGSCHTATTETSQVTTCSGEVGNCGDPDKFGTTDSDGCASELSGEYTTEQMQADAITLLPPWGAIGSFAGSLPGELASAELSSNGMSYSIMDGRYQWAHLLPPTGLYRVSWIERFTPDGGGSPTDTAQNYEWDGVKPPSYNAADKTTWPKSRVFEVDHPVSNGSVRIVGLTVDCGGGAVAI